MSGHCLNEAISALTGQVKWIEQNVLKKIRLRKAYKNLISVIGIGKILALTIMLETGSESSSIKTDEVAGAAKAIR
jgi:hypothetical protein